ncbi:hypothetical protein [Lactiplantibacillus mudanjiangensis]|uniref:Uncharacterized protein n=1 Tax=Lactiplantibacillus mudanjiangensis TaxID=1296538 RepID=A0A660E0I7_9LACO|nr:hypothetical protein [Lactiplantibacillus mudanjiangensis]VDG25490.1 hypothetical protein MUDAN_IGPPGNFN_03290 [Lactiplantibacillus mudanjiangensis]VDG27922.1 hypothetical protein MUDAN_MDHGFNIF_02739 [Lactiplantibacillus mudanjiangensis]VDG32495.1 hypothetical protein MUDAN_DOGOELCO_01752 [Lactiplantibacillus mudanjiangensis]
MMKMELDFANFALENYKVIDHKVFIDGNNLGITVDTEQIPDKNEGDTYPRYWITHFDYGRIPEYMLKYNMSFYIKQAGNNAETLGCIIIDMPKPDRAY